MPVDHAAVRRGRDDILSDLCTNQSPEPAQQFDGFGSESDTNRADLVSSAKNTERLKLQHLAMPGHELPEFRRDRLRKCEQHCIPRRRLVSGDCV